MASRQQEPTADERPHYQRLLVATDFSRSARRALRRALRLRLADRAVVTVLHVLPAKLPRELAPQVEQGAREQLDKTVGEAREQLRRAGMARVEVRALLSRGKPFVEIIRRGRALGAELLVLGRGAPRRGMRGWLLGATAERVVRKGDLPVLVVSQPPARSYQQVLAAVDLTDTSFEIAQLALRFVAEGGELALLHAFQLPFEGAMETYLPDEQVFEYRQQLRVDVQQLLSQLAGQLETPPGVGLVSIARRGEPRVLVLQEAMRRGADLVVLGTHGRAGLSHALLGSVAESVLRSSPCDVLVSRPARFSFQLP